MKIDLVFPVLPPRLDGIGDHTANLARALSQAGCDVRIWTADDHYAEIEGVDIRVGFGLDRPWDVRALRETVATDPPDWLLLQFNQFSYGQYGFNPWLPLTLQSLRDDVPGMRIAWMAHEDFVPVISWKFAIMTLWQRWQFRQLGRTADQIFFSIDPWARRYRTWFDAPVAHAPVGSNMPYLGFSREEARRAVGIPDDAFVAGVFGTLAGNARPLDSLSAALRAVAETDPSLQVLYVGPHGELLRNAVPELSVHDAGRLPADDVSIHLSAMDLHLAPFHDGMSTRRGSAMAGLQHGVATVSTAGELTDQMLLDAAGDSFLLTPTDDVDAFVQAACTLCADTERRQAVGASGKHLFDAHFSWDSIAQGFISAMAAHDSEESAAETGEPSRPETSVLPSP